MIITSWYSFKERIDLWIWKALVSVSEVLHLRVRAIPIVLMINIAATLITGRILEAMIPGGGGHVSGMPDLQFRKMVLEMNILDLWVAGLEDLAFVLPLFALRGSRAFLPAMVILAFIFTFGHAYQGQQAMLAKAAWVPTVYLLAKEYGIFTTSLAHVVQDMAAVSLLKILLQLFKGAL